MLDTVSQPRKDYLVEIIFQTSLWPADPPDPANPDHLSAELSALFTQAVQDTVLYFLSWPPAHLSKAPSYEIPLTACWACGELVRRFSGLTPPPDWTLDNWLQLMLRPAAIQVRQVWQTLAIEPTLHNVERLTIRLCPVCSAPHSSPTSPQAIEWVGWKTFNGG